MPSKSVTFCPALKPLARQSRIGTAMAQIRSGMDVFTVMFALTSMFLSFLAVLVVLWINSAKARYYIKFLGFCVSSLIFTGIAIPTMLWDPGNPKNALIPAALLRHFAEKILGLKLSVDGKENIVNGSGCVVLINHQSMLDLIVLACLWPEMDNCTVISKKEILYIPPFGLAAWLWGTIFIERTNAKDAQSAVNKTGETIKKRKARVLMFPEGTRHFGEKLLPFKKGAFHLALASQSPIQPVAVNRYTFLKNGTFENGTIKIRILPAISTEGCTKDDIPKLIEQTSSVLTKYVDILTEEVDRETQINGVDKKDQ